MNTFARHLAVTLTLTILLATPVAAQKKHYGNKEREDIHIYVFTAEKDADSVADLKKVLARAHFTVVNSQSDADFSIEVERGYVLTRTLAAPGVFSSTMLPGSVAAVKLTLAAGDHSTTTVATSLPSVWTVCRCHPTGTWTAAAATAESQLDTWVQSNYDHLIALRNSGK